MTPEVRDRLRGFLNHAEIHLVRGNVDAAREALADARRLLAQHGLLDLEFAW